jgi:hypothetical protein
MGTVSEGLGLVLVVVGVLLGQCGVPTFKLFQGQLHPAGHELSCGCRK